MKTVGKSAKASGASELFGAPASLLLCLLVALILSAGCASDSPPGIPKKEIAYSANVPPQTFGRPELEEKIGLLEVPPKKLFDRGAILPLLSTNDVPWLNQVFLQATNARVRQGVARLLGHLGNAETVSIFTNSVIALAKLKQQDDDERGLTRTLVDQLGHLSSQSDEAFSFLRAGMKRSFWKSETGLPSPPNILERDGFALLAEYSASALGFSGRPEIPALLEEVKSWPLRMQGDICGGVVDGVFNDLLLRQHGRSIFVVESQREQFDRFSAWVHTEEGHKWRHWAVSVMSKTTAIPRYKR